MIFVENKSCQELINDVEIAKDNYKPVGREMSTAEILESLRLEKMSDPYHYDYVEERNDEYESVEFEKSEKMKKVTKSDFHNTDSIENEVFISCHQRVCQKSLDEIKNSLPKYNRLIPNLEVGEHQVIDLGVVEEYI